MKFSELAIGARFMLDGEAYLKTGPLVATHEASGRARFIGRYLIVAPVGEQRSAAPAAAAPGGELSAERVMAALDGMCRRWEAMFDRLPLAEQQREEASAALAAAREEFLAALRP